MCPFSASARPFWDAMRPTWAGLCAPTVGKPLFAKSWPAFVRPWWAGLCAPTVGWPLCAQKWQASVRPKWAGLRVHSGPASVRPKWAGLCAAILFARTDFVIMWVISMHMCVYSEPLCVQLWMLRPKWAGLCGQTSVRPFWAGLCAATCPCARQFYNYVIYIGAYVRPFSATARPFWDAMRPKWDGLCAPTVGSPLCAHAGQAFVGQFLYLCAPHFKIM